MSMPRKLRCAVESIVDHGGRVYTVELKPERPVPAFLPGQFLHLTVDDFDPAGFWPESRVFSIASSPAQRDRIRICYSVKGRYTQKIERTLAVGREVWIKLPYGEFVIQPDGEVVLFAGGTGISAFAAFVEMLTPPLAQPVTLVYGARSPELLLFSDVILARFDHVPAFQAVFFVETGAPELVSRFERQPRVPRCFPGRISLPQVWPLLPNPTGSVFYLAGPPVMISALSSGLQTHGAGPEQVRVDAWE
jgi:NAD(P)H-flavin reductase